MYEVSNILNFRGRLTFAGKALFVGSMPRFVGTMKYSSISKWNAYM
jgi:hypothetical protein